MANAIQCIIPEVTFFCKKHLKQVRLVRIQLVAIKELAYIICISFSARID